MTRETHGATDAMVVQPGGIYDDAALRLGLGLTSAALSKARRDGSLRFTRKGNRTLYLGTWVLAWIGTSDSEPPSHGKEAAL